LPCQGAAGYFPSAEFFLVSTLEKLKSFATYILFYRKINILTLSLFAKVPLYDEYNKKKLLLLSLYVKILILKVPVNFSNA